MIEEKLESFLENFEDVREYIRLNEIIDKRKLKRLLIAIGIDDQDIPKVNRFKLN